MDIFPVRKNSLIVKFLSPQCKLVGREKMPKEENFIVNGPHNQTT